MEMIMAKDLMRAKIVKEARVARAWPQQQLATISGVTLRTIQRLEKDGAASFETLRGVAQAFEMDVKDLNPFSVSTRGKKPVSTDKKVYLLSRLLTGKSVTEIVDGTDAYEITHDGANEKETIQAMRTVLLQLRRDMVRMSNSNDPIEKFDLEVSFSNNIQRMEKLGFYLFGVRRSIQRIIAGKSAPFLMCTFFLTHTNSNKIVRDRKLNMVIPALLSEVSK